MRKQQLGQKVPFPASDVVTKVVPSPTDGWDAISPLAAMDPKRAPILDNWVPRPGWVELRQGYTPWTLRLTTTPVETLAVWRGPTLQKMFAASGGKIFDVSTVGLATQAVSGLTSNRWQYINFTPANAATVIQLVNGVDPLQQYNGTTWSVPSITGLPSSGPTSNIINIHAQKRRIWYALKNSTIAAFMPTDAISGAIAGTIDLGALWTKGGYLVAFADWTSDSGLGPQDHMCFISSRGQIALYDGTDPTNSAAWQLDGVFDLSPPIGNRCAFRVGSDVALIMLEGLLPLSKALPYDPSADRSVAFTARIQNAMALAAATAQLNFGWQTITFPAQQLLIMNVPLVENSQQVQYVANTISGGWCRFTGWSANCFEIFNDLLYFGDNTGNVNQGYNGGLDGNNPIPADMQCAFNYFDDPGRTKRMTMVQPLMNASGQISPLLSVDADFATNTTASTITLFQGGAKWDVARWDVDFWSGGTINIINWDSVNVIGHALAIRMKVNVGSTASGVATAQGFDAGVFDTAAFDALVTGAGTAPILQVNAFNAVMELGGYI